MNTIDEIFHRTCPKCNQLQPLTNFTKNKTRKNGYECWCRKCMTKKSIQWRHNNPERSKRNQQRWAINNPNKTKINSKKWRQNHPDQMRQIKKLWNNNNPEKIKLQNRRYSQKHSEKICQRVKIWRQTHPEQIQQQRQKTYQESYKNPLIRLIGGQRQRIRQLLQKNNLRKNNRTLAYLGCTLETLKNHLEQQFVDGMTWENRGMFGWHVDHIQPLSRFDLTDPEQLQIAFWYTNLQPLWWRDNLKKSNN